MQTILDEMQWDGGTAHIVTPEAAELCDMLREADVNCARFGDTVIVNPGNIIGLLVLVGEQNPLHEQSAQGANPNVKVIQL